MTLNSQGLPSKRYAIKYCEDPHLKGSVKKIKYLNLLKKWTNQL
jgi:hypothetical protein